MTRIALLERFAATAIGIALLSAIPVTALAQHDHDHDHGTAPAVWTCEVASTPAASHAGHHDDEATPADEGTVVQQAEFDQLYIDMMIPHHTSIIALAQAALPHLTDPRLKEMARSIMNAQTDENTQLTAWRNAWYGSGEPAMDEASMNQMLEAMPVGTMDEMMLEMDAAAQVSAFCTAANPDLAFIQQVTRHHQMAIDVSAIAVKQAVHPEVAGFAQGVITAQQAEIDTLKAILAEMESATPEG
jgi:uncharacterized protein (DUF305 family)